MLFPGLPQNPHQLFQSKLIIFRLNFPERKPLKKIINKTGVETNPLQKNIKVV